MLQDLRHEMERGSGVKGIRTYGECGVPSAYSIRLFKDLNTVSLVRKKQGGSQTAGTGPNNDNAFLPLHTAILERFSFIV